MLKKDTLYPIYLKTNRLFSELLASEFNEIELLNRFSEVFTKEITPALSDEWLSDWEQMMGLKTLDDKSTEIRQSNIVSLLRSSGTLSRNRLKEIALSFKNGEVEFLEDIAKYSFIVKFTSTLGKPPNFDDFMNTVRNVIPAHLKVSYEFTYNTYGILEKYKHDEVVGYTHKQLRNEVQ